MVDISKLSKDELDVYNSLKTNVKNLFSLGSSDLDLDNFPLTANFNIDNAIERINEEDWANDDIVEFMITLFNKRYGGEYSIEDVSLFIF